MTCDGNDGNITLHYITLREDIILYLVMVCITKAGCFMTCDGNITLHYIT